MLLSAVSVLVVEQLSSEIPEGLMNNPVYKYLYKLEVKHLDFISCIPNSCNLKNVCNLARHWL